MKVLIFGGSFDPAHAGHFELLKAAVKQIKPEKTVVVPAFHSPFKAASATPFEKRMKAARALFSPLGAEFDDFEFKRGKKTFAWQVIDYLKKKYAGAELFLLVGADCAADLLKWKKADYILKNVTPVYGAREGFAACKPPFKAVKLKGKFPRVSSSEIRIKTWLKGNLKPARYKHTLAVAELADKLAKKWGADREKAHLAGLLHDMAKEKSTPLNHAKDGAKMAARIFGIKDKEILSAVAQHTLGAPRMSLLSKILYVADSGSPDRKYAAAYAVRKLAFKDLDAAAALVKKNKTERYG